MRTAPVALVLVALVSPTLTPAAAQESIASDRPGIGSGSFVLGSGTVQAETGIEIATPGEATQYSIGQALVRVGLSAFEAQLLLGSVVALRAGGESDFGAGDLGVGIKTRMFESADGGVRVSTLGTVSFPTGADFLTNDEWVPALTLLADVVLSPTWSLATNVGYAASDPGVLSLIVTPGVVLPFAQGLGAFFGYAGFFSEGRDEHFVEGGLTLVRSPDVQLDVNGGVETDSGNFFVGVGVAFRRLPG